MHLPSRKKGLNPILARVFASLAGVGAASGQPILYVDASASGGTHDGSSWCNAYLTLHPALVAATGGTTIRVANGVYHPDPTGLPDPRQATFTLKNGVTVEGGYAGCGAPNPNARDVTTYATVLSGDVAGNDPAGDEFRDCCHATYQLSCPETGCAAAVCASNSICCEFQWEEACAASAQTLCASLCQTNADNCHHVVTGSGTNATAVLDGVTVTEGKADTPNYESPDASGGGLYALNGSPSLRTIRFSSNDAFAYGGGAYLKDSSAQVINCEFTDNRARSYDTEGGSGGGAAYVESGTPFFSGCEMTANQGDGFGSGGLMLVGGNAIISDTFLQGNWGAGMDLWNGTIAVVRCRILGNGGGLRIDGGTVTIRETKIVGNYGAGIATQGGTQTVINCLIAGNFAGAGGGALTTVGGSTNITNSTLHGNFAFINGGAIEARGSATVACRNSIVWGNTADLQGDAIYMRTLSGTFVPQVTVSNSAIQGGQSEIAGSGTLIWGSGNTDQDPVFVDANGADELPGNEDDDLHLVNGSPCVDIGDNAFVPIEVISDLDGSPRIFDGNKDGASVVDLGAYESLPGVPTLSGIGIAVLISLILTVGLVLIRLRVGFLLCEKLRSAFMPPPPPNCSESHFVDRAWTSAVWRDEGFRPGCTLHHRTLRSIETPEYQRIPTAAVGRVRTRRPSRRRLY